MDDVAFFDQDISVDSAPEVVPSPTPAPPSSGSNGLAPAMFVPAAPLDSSQSSAVSNSHVSPPHRDTPAAAVFVPATASYVPQAAPHPAPPSPAATFASFQQPSHLPAASFPAHSGGAAASYAPQQPSAFSPGPATTQAPGGDLGFGGWEAGFDGGAGGDPAGVHPRVMLNRA